MKEFIKVTRALAEPNRVKILKLLQRKSMYVNEIQEVLGIAQPTVSSHLKLLVDAGLVAYRREGLWVRYSLADGSSTPYAASLLGSLRHWLEDSPEMRKLADSLHGEKRQRGTQQASAPCADRLILMANEQYKSGSKKLGLQKQKEILR